MEGKPRAWEKKETRKAKSTTDTLELVAFPKRKHRLPLWVPTSKERNRMYEGIELERWGKGIPHDPRSEQIVRALVDIDFNAFGDYFCWKVGGDGDNGESLMYELEVYFELLDKRLIQTKINT
jgi:hypothetical protein